MVLSMTGYGKASNVFGEKSITVELKSLNSKQIDIVVKSPIAYREKELEIRKIVADCAVRGKIEVVVSESTNGSKSKIVIDAEIVNSYYQQIKQIADQSSIPEPSDWFGTLLAIPDVFVHGENTLNKDEWIIVENTIKEAIEALSEFRRNEGKMLENYLIVRAKNIEKLLKEIDTYEPERVAKIRENMQEAVESIKNRVELDKNRLEQEMFFHLEKLDVSEEKSRLQAHINYFLTTISGETHQGKKLGFIAQEMGREINTLGSKSNHSRMQQLVVEMKDELEQIKEQILNVL